MSYKAPRGTSDILEEEIYTWQNIEQMLRDFCYVYNYDEIRTPTFENTGVFLRENDSSDMVNKEMYTFSPKNSKDSLTLRPEGTAGVIRSYVEHKKYALPDLPVKYYYLGPMHRHERPQKGRLRIFNQFGVENLGLKSPYIDAEVILLGYSILKSLGIDKMEVQINSLGDEQSRFNYSNALKEYFGAHLDELCTDCKRRYEQNPLRILDCKIDGNSELVQNAPLMKDYLSKESQDYFETLQKLLKEAGIDFVINDRLVRGLDYYTDTVFEMVSTDEKTKGLALLAGGRYDRLIEESGGPAQSGIGFAAGLERLILMLQEKEGLMEKPELDVYVMVLSDKAKDYAFSLLSKLRAHGYRSEMENMGRSLKGQFKASERNKAKVLLLVGEKEAENQNATIKNVEDGLQQEIEAEKLIETLDHLFGVEHD